MLNGGKTSIELIYLTRPQSPHHCQLIVYLFGFRSDKSNYPPKNAWTLPHELKQVTLSSCSCVLRYEWRRRYSVMLISEECFCLAKLILSQSLRRSLQTNLIQLAVLQQMAKYSIIIILLVLFLMSNWTVFKIYFSFKTAMFEPSNPFFQSHITILSRYLTKWLIFPEELVTIMPPWRPCVWP